MRAKRFHGLKKIKLRQTWSKYNLYNLSRVTAPNIKERTYYQQKWSAKSITRAYHGEAVREKKWQRMFRPYIRSVVPMNHTYLAETDGSDEAAGRGSGKDVQKAARTPPRTPYMNMVYAELERRLDTAVFRAMFASSARQAREFVIHGYVKVNGKKMIYPGYRLNPGDMFQVEPDRVLFATGAPKDRQERRASRVYRSKMSAKDKEDPDTPSQSLSTPTKNTSSTDPPEPKEPKNILPQLLDHAKNILSKPSDDLTAKRKQSLRAFQLTLKRTLSRPNSLTDSIDAQLQEMAHKLNISLPASTTEPDAYDSPAPTPSRDNNLAKTMAISDSEKRLLKRALIDARENPIDPSKPYATPWRPREYMSAFAFIPRYLEVHHKVCSAVYLRHPVARPGMAEVPTPYNIEQNGLAFNWYLRRR
ncbi:MAG: mitochondrial 37S ribosomal protein nam9 [Heterodermia speciosa]|uniref:Mitochondrial 37S ribosomal protein nam9 n=1 Tax=Heterodermia speciosa TaxID=116794 RepID=A0A8H3IYE2_9LECA|nr:MAG: mitochondrial 37S ribosomal protein nam9 [Heterodermia speciosa]